MTTLVANTFGWLGLVSISNWLKTLSVKLNAHQCKQATIKELSALSDKDLTDIGLSRGDIRHLAQKHYNDIVNDNLKGWV